MQSVAVSRMGFGEARSVLWMLAKLALLWSVDRIKEWVCWAVVAAASHLWCVVSGGWSWVCAHWCLVAGVVLCAALAYAVWRYVRRPVFFPVSEAERLLLAQERALRIRKSVAEAMQVVGKRALTTDPELAVKCDDCRAVAAQLIPPEFLEPLFKTLDKAESVDVPHNCPFGRRAGPPLLIAKYMGLVDGAVVRAVGSRVPEGEGKNKPWLRRDRKHYVRGGKFHSGKALMLDDDYDRMLNKLEGGRLNEAVMDYMETTGELYNPHGHETADDAHGHDFAAHARAVRAAEDRIMHIAERAGISSREFWDAVRGRHPEALPAKVDAGKRPLVAEAKGVQVFGEHENFNVVVTPEALAAHNEECARLQQLHRERTREAQVKANQKKDADVAESSNARPMSYQDAKSQDAVAAVQPGPKDRRRRNRKKHAPEGAVASSTAYDKDAVVAAVQFTDGRVMQGYLMKKEGNQVWFVTGRHKVLNDPEGMRTVDGFGNAFSKESVTLIRPGYGKETVSFAERRGNGDDRVCLRLVGNIPNVPAARVAEAQMGGVVTAKHYCRLTDRWYDVQGTVAEVTDTVVAYDMSTRNGCCRMPVFDARGRVVAGHYYPYIVTAKGRFPGGEVEDGSLPSKWVVEYQPSPVNPQGDAPGLTSIRGPNLRTEKHKICALRSDVDLTGYKAEYHMAKPSTEMLHNELAKFFEPLGCTFEPELLRIAGEAVLLLEWDGRCTVQEPTLDDFENELRGMDNDRTNAGSDEFGTTHHEYILYMGDGDAERGIQVVAKRAHYLWECITGRRKADLEDEEEIRRLHMWCVQGKRDGYKYKKLYVGRSIQAPSLTFKLMYRVQMAKADEHWISRGYMFRAGYDMDVPVSDDLVVHYRDAVASLGLDESGFDRRMPREFMEYYFKQYMPYMHPGIDAKYCHFLADATIDSLLVLTDGAVYAKDRGNPSGYPNTLRLNCVVQLYAWCYAMAYRLRELGLPYGSDAVDAIFTGDIFLEICGDDSRANVLTRFGEELMDTDGRWEAWLKIWRERLPWEVKIEGQVVFEHEYDIDGTAVFTESFPQRMARMPPLVARCLFVVDNMLWSPLWNAARCVRKLMSEGGNRSVGPLGRTDEEEYVLRVSAFMSLKVLVKWHLDGIVYSPTIECLIANGWYTKEIATLVQASYARVWAEGHWHRRPVSYYC